MRPRSCQGYLLWSCSGLSACQGCHEILIDHESCRDRTYNQTARELSKVLEGIPDRWKVKIINGDSVSPSTAPPSFSILPSAPDKPRASVLDCKTRHFYWHFHKTEQILTPGLDYWRTGVVSASGPFWLRRRYGTLSTQNWSHKGVSSSKRVLR